MNSGIGVGANDPWFYFHGTDYLLDNKGLYKWNSYLDIFNKISLFSLAWLFSGLLL